MVLYEKELVVFAGLQFNRSKEILNTCFLIMQG